MRTIIVKKNDGTQRIFEDVRDWYLSGNLLNIERYKEYIEPDIKGPGSRKGYGGYHKTNTVIPVVNGMEVIVEMDSKTNEYEEFLNSPKLPATQEHLAFSNVVNKPT